MSKILTRREFLTRTVSAGAATIILGNTSLAPGINKSVRIKDPLQMVTLGNTGIKTTFLGMGTGFSGGNRSSNITRAGVAESLIRQAYEKGIRFFDCADSYGTHPYTATALKGFPREEYTVFTKMWVGQGGVPEPERPEADVVVERFRKELDSDYIDLVQIHCMTDALWTDRQKRQMDKLENLKAKNIIRAHGVSVHSLEAMEAAADSPWVDVIHVRVNPYGEAMDKKDPSLVIPVIEKLHKSGKGVIGMKLIGNGNFRNDSDKIDASLNYVLGLGTVDLITVGFENPEQIDNYLARIRNAIA
ncbi:MAG TPA: aldo/keto reductase [Bacteroidales bacterium]|nr:aldo/keto reductase [Bacteroidales bacterium]HBH82821.1 aldo/keto reductase [Bacteroidales bacterium]HBQ84449.1 aldo/keto reductase [Bacteroidales bacterium]HCU17709.1 aldo/keto reductase [Bacteroidales bacterium]